VRSTVFDHARLYLSLGLAVLPLHRPVDHGEQLRCSCGKSDCDSPAKHPAGHLAPHGLRDASRNANIVAKWFEGENWNIGIATGAASGVVVLDIDPRHGGDETLADLEIRYGPLPSTWRFFTGGGGEHIAFRHAGSKVKTSAGQIGPGIDMRGDGGYIVAPPSLHMSGHPYAISVDHHPDDVALASLPDWLLCRVTEPAAPLITGGRLKIGREPTDWRRQLGRSIAEGERNAAMTRLAGLLLGRRLNPHVCLDLMLAFNAAQCRPPLPGAEVATTLASIARREIASRRRERPHG
jgi:putative DNA primase/helicase